MLKAVSSITNAIGAVNYKGLWNASTNSPALASGAGTTGDYYIVGTAGTTSIDSTATWYVGDWIVFNGSTWQRLQGGADDPAPSVKSNSTTGVMQITGPAAAATRVVTIPDANATMARTDAAQSFTGDQTLATGNLVIGTSGKGIDFSADGQAASMTSELLSDYEHGNWTPTLVGSGGGTPTYNTTVGTYIKIGNTVIVNFWIYVAAPGGLAGNLTISGLPFAKDSSNTRPASALRANVMTITGQCFGWIADGSSSITLIAINNGASSNLTDAAIASSTEIDGTFSYQV